jgi:two-component system OmpR family response regulator
MEPAPHIAVVDDHREIRELVSRYLSAARLSRRAQRQARANSASCSSAACFDLVVLDIMMPGEDGLALCRQLRDRTAGLPRSNLPDECG